MKKYSNFFQRGIKYDLIPRYKSLLINVFVTKIAIWGMCSDVYFVDVSNSS